MSSTHSSGNLLHLLADLSRTPQLVDRFASDPLAVFREYKVPEDKLALLRSRDAKQIVDAIALEAAALLESVKSPPIVENPWPANGISVASCTPNRGQVSTQIAFTVLGKLFADNAVLSFRNPKAKVQGKDVKVVTDKEGNSKLTAYASFKDAGVYDVVVTNPSTGDAGTLPQGFTAT